MSVGRQVLKRLQNDCSANYETQRCPEPTRVGRTEQQAKERVGDNPLIERIVTECRANANWRQGDENDGAQHKPGGDCKISLKHSVLNSGNESWRFKRRDKRTTSQSASAPSSQAHHSVAGMRSCSKSYYLVCHWCLTAGEVECASERALRRSPRTRTYRIAAYRIARSRPTFGDHARCRHIVDNADRRPRQTSAKRLPVKPQSVVVAKFSHQTSLSDRGSYLIKEACRQFNNKNIIK
jgi:hypothetical protein